MRAAVKPVSSRSEVVPGWIGKRALGDARFPSQGTGGVAVPSTAAATPRPCTSVRPADSGRAPATTHIGGSSHHSPGQSAAGASLPVAAFGEQLPGTPILASCEAFRLPPSAGSRASCRPDQGALPRRVGVPPRALLSGGRS